MGCANSHYSSDRTCRVFRVHNVDDQGNKLSPGKLEVSDVDLILHQTGKEAIRWPLRCLRRYGFDADLFSFESGRRCPTGQGIYAFCCRNAEDLFNLVQESIKDEQNRANHNFVASSATSVSRLPTSRPASSHIEPYEANHDVARHNANNNSHAGLPPDAGLPNGDDGHLYVNAIQADHNYVNTELAMGERYDDNVLVDFLEHPDDVAAETDDIPQSLQGLDIKMDDLNLNLLGYSQVSNVRPVTSCDVAAKPATIPCSRSADLIHSNKSNARSRMNGHALSVPLDPGATHDYANIVTSEPDATQATKSKRVRPIQMNYIQLDLSRSTENLAGTPSPTSPVALLPLPESPTRASIGYAQIDFNKTNALQMSNCNRHVDDPDDGVRKTRHNSTINDK